jgi:hypothetical protein
MFLRACVPVASLAPWTVSSCGGELVDLHRDVLARLRAGGVVGALDGELLRAVQQVGDLAERRVGRLHPPARLGDVRLVLGGGVELAAGEHGALGPDRVVGGPQQLALAGDLALGEVDAAGCGLEVGQQPPRHHALGDADAHDASSRRVAAAVGEDPQGLTGPPAPCG